MLYKGGGTGKWHVFGDAEWPAITNANHCAPDACARCQEQRPLLQPVKVTDRFGRTIEERVCVRCMGDMNGSKKTRRTQPVKALTLQASREPLPHKSYTVGELAKLVGRHRKTVSQLATQWGMGREEQLPDAEYHYRLLSWEEAEQLRQTYVERDDRVAAKLKRKAPLKMKLYS